MKAQSLYTILYHTMNLDRNVLTIIYWYIHDNITRDLIVEYHSRVKRVFDYIKFNGWDYNFRSLGKTDMSRSIYNLHGKPIYHDCRYLKVPINY